MNKVTIVFCEGDHDIAILTKILLVHGYEPYRKKVKDFPIALSNMYFGILSNKTIEDSEFKPQRPNKGIPYVTLHKDDELVVFHNLGGDGNIDNGSATSIMTDYNDLNDEVIRKISNYEKISFKFLYFLDSDDKGVDFRLSQIKDILDLEFIELNKLVNKGDYSVGCYVFHDSSHDLKHGKLEDLLIDLMKLGNDSIFDKSVDFIDNNKLDSCRQRKLVCCYSEDDSYKGSVQFKKEKSIISIAGQLQFSGSSNSVIIANSDYIRSEDIINNDYCNDIMELF